MSGSNRRPPACKAGALPAELIPLCLRFDKRRHAALLKPSCNTTTRRDFVPCLTRFSNLIRFYAEIWWVWMDSNHRPPPYQGGALTN